MAYKELSSITVNLNFDELAAWRNPEMNEVPVCSLMSFYQACGLEPHLKKYYEENDHKEIVALDNLTCNFYTLQKIRNFITENWQTYSIDIDADSHVFWDTKKWEKDKKHYKKKLKAKVQNSLNWDFANFCPGVDDELPDDVIVFTIYEKIEDEPEDESAEKAE